VADGGGGVWFGATRSGGGALTVSTFSIPVAGGADAILVHVSPTPTSIVLAATSVRTAAAEYLFMLAPYGAGGVLASVRTLAASYTSPNSLTVASPAASWTVLQALDAAGTVLLHSPYTVSAGGKAEVVAVQVVPAGDEDDGSNLYVVVVEQAGTVDYKGAVGPQTGAVVRAVLLDERLVGLQHFVLTYDNGGSFPDLIEDVAQTAWDPRGSVYVGLIACPGRNLYGVLMSSNNLLFFARVQVSPFARLHMKSLGTSNTGAQTAWIGLVPTVSGLYNVVTLIGSKDMLPGMPGAQCAPCTMQRLFQLSESTEPIYYDPSAPATNSAIVYGGMTLLHDCTLVVVGGITAGTVDFKGTMGVVTAPAAYVQRYTLPRCTAGACQWTPRRSLAVACRRRCCSGLGGRRGARTGCVVAGTRSRTTPSARRRRSWASLWGP
jgi:hypothetical protein